ncbi:TPA: TetR/AcrR family transcriptional regulator [Streptococcus pyogenes]|uniref:TetR/AcrR family transcriptional regulator n=1 Tax=Peptoniphilaceae TaxID=1570339 RepID=UPI0008A36DCF|nr:MULTISPECIES: TetR/AcrR family transcriptional regulator [Peptoniphilaceae]HER5437322.1 TetR/AcrR family transcriptional regulator [Streptococcus pyogenes]MDU6182778.1 TetR/AcrR family transcriptional regulator [Anaerococcus vaginalis]OFL15042.1 TetR family transcriptional regulator [Anaerococcus sp. HMSC068A02]HER5440956.1 TetR/AcrR family transcriptional regulator [Streptococcus pyogenes]HER5441706.1 TetR/AcrR family transcriptional regulator [Streptococcus pyogenes]
MAKAFTEEEKIKIKEDIIETALDLFHDKGTKSLSISELTKRVGIAQGSFYNFWKDKESLVIDLMAYRSIQKLENIEKEFSNSLTNPKKFLSEVIFKYSIDMTEKIRNQQIYQEAFRIFASQDSKKVNRVENLYGDFLDRLIDYWYKNKVVKSVDKQGLSNAFVGSFVLCSNYFHFNEDTFEEVLNIYIQSIVFKYIEI